MQLSTYVTKVRSTFVYNLVRWELPLLKVLHAVKRVFMFDRIYSFDVSNSLNVEQSKENL